MIFYNPRNWYWQVAQSNTHVYSSAIGDYVEISNPTYVAWLAAGSNPTKISDEASLGEVLAEYNLRPTASNVLESYKETLATKLPFNVLAKILLWVINEIRTLKGQGTITAQQFKTFVKDQI
jgi:hypothetical protein